MRMTSCKKCEDIIDKSVEKCENCGTPNDIKQRKSIFGIITFFVPIVALLIIFKIIIA